jgi:hypothetical protein
MQPPPQHTATYTGNEADGNSTNHYGDHYGDKNVHYHGRLDSDHCLRDLRVTDPREDKARIGKSKDILLQQCYSWILEDASFQRWRAKGDTHLLWIKGDPGKGKTMMTMGLINELSPKDGSSAAITYFFCQSTRQELNNAVSVLRGLIYLLVDKEPELLRHVQKRYKAAGSGLFDGPNGVYALREILSDILHDPKLPMTLLLIDALDECTSGRDELLHIITDDSLAPRSRVKWLVTSRNLPDIEWFLQPNSSSDQVSLELNANHISKAVAAFIDFKVQGLAAVKKYDPTTQAQMRQMLRDKAEDTFLWISLVCKDMESVPRYRTMSVLRKLPSGLNPLYDRIKEQILELNDEETVEYCKDILQSVICAYRPLHLKELAATAGLPTNELADIEDLISRCGSFLTTREGTVFFIHLSAKDYFTVGNGSQMLPRMLIEEQKQRWITHRLLDAMNTTMHRDICNLQKPGVRIEEVTSCIEGSVLPRLTYACEHWIDHLCGCTLDDDNILLDDGKAHHFFQEHFLHWLEAMSLLKKIPDALAAVRKLQSVLTVSR